MFRNPWGHSGYSGVWCESDPNWTDDLVAQVPHGIDPRTASTIDGIFIAPKTVLPSTLYSETGCIAYITINHHRDDEGYTDDWIDAIDMDEENHVYKF